MKLFRKERAVSTLVILCLALILIALAVLQVRWSDEVSDADSARKWIQVFDDPRQKAVRRWLPESLVREVAPLRKSLGLPSP